MGGCRVTCFAVGRGPWLSPIRGGRRLATTISSWGFISIGLHGDAPTRPNGQLWPCPALPLSTSPWSPAGVTSGSPCGRGPWHVSEEAATTLQLPFGGPLLNLLNQSSWREEFGGRVASQGHRVCTAHAPESLAGWRQPELGRGQLLTQAGKVTSGAGCQPQFIWDSAPASYSGNNCVIPEEVSA